MVELIIVAHAPLASALQRVAEHAFPEFAGLVKAVDVEATDCPDAVEQRLRALVADAPEALLMVDAFGATPSNVALRLADGLRVRVLAGVNVPMVWRAVSYREQPLEKLVGLAQTGATQGVTQVFNTRLQHQPVKAPGHATDYPHDQ